MYRIEPSKTSHSRQAGFTLIELLVVIAIIAILATILLPSLRKAQDLARGVACGNNLRSQGIALKFLTDESEGVYPHTGFWGGTQSWKFYLFPYLDLPLYEDNDIYKLGAYPEFNGSVFDCPANKHLFGVGGTYEGDCRDDYGVGYNMLFAYIGGNRGANEYAIQSKLSKEIAFSESLSEIAVTADYNSEIYPTQGALFFSTNPAILLYTSGSTAGRLGTFHSDDANVLYLDGSVDIGNSRVLEKDNFIPGWPCW